MIVGRCQQTKLQRLYSAYDVVNNNNNNIHICIAPYGRNFRGACSSMADGIRLKNAYDNSNTVVNIRLAIHL